MSTIADLIRAAGRSHSMPVADHRGNLHVQIIQLSKSLGIERNTLMISVISIEKDNGYSRYKFKFVDQDAAADFYNNISKKHVYGDEANIGERFVSFRAAGGQGRLLDKVVKSLDGLNGETKIRSR